MKNKYLFDVGSMKNATDGSIQFIIGTPEGDYKVDSVEVFNLLYNLEAHLDAIGLKDEYLKFIGKAKNENA